MSRQNPRFVDYRVVARVKGQEVRKEFEMKSDVILLSHYDLDGAGCSVIADHIWNVVDRKHQGYGKIRKSLGYLIGEYYQKITLTNLPTYNQYDGSN